MSPEKGWKKGERMLAGDVGTERVPVTGVDRHGYDFASGWNQPWGGLGA